MNGDKVDRVLKGDTFTNAVLSIRKEGDSLAVKMREASRYYNKPGVSVKEPVFCPEVFITGALESGLQVLSWKSFEQYTWPPSYSAAQIKTSSLYDTFAVGC